MTLSAAILPHSLLASYVLPIRRAAARRAPKCQASHDVASWLRWRRYNFAAKGGGESSSRSTLGNRRKG
eukprot:6053271-Alexandrium_andersonii.AAC.1